MTNSEFRIADLFCGAGGTSTGAIEAVEGLGYQARLTAVNQRFPDGYQFAGNKTEVVKQIGNAVPRRLARAIVRAVVSQKTGAQ